MGYKFEQLRVWHQALEYNDLVFAVAQELPSSEKYGLRSQILRAADSIALNIAEGSTSQSDAEQARFLGFAIRSLTETVACMHLIKRRGYLRDVAPLREAYQFSETLFAQLQAFRSSLQKKRGTIREEQASYGDESGRLF